MELSLSPANCINVVVEFVYLFYPYSSSGCETTLTMPSSSFAGALVDRTTEAVVVAQVVAMKSAAAVRGIDSSEEENGERMVDMAIESRMQFIDISYPPVKENKPSKRNYYNNTNITNSIANPTSWIRLEHAWKRLRRPPANTSIEVIPGSHSNTKWLSIIARLSLPSMVRYDPSIGYAKINFPNKPIKIIDDYVPWRDSEPMHCQTTPSKAFIVLIEKCLSKQVGSYANLASSIGSTEEMCSYFGYVISEFLFTDGISLFESEMRHKFSPNSTFLSDFVILLKPLSAPTIRLESPLSMYFVKGVTDGHVVVDSPLTAEELVIPISRMGNIFYSWAVAERTSPSETPLQIQQKLMPITPRSVQLPDTYSSAVIPRNSTENSYGEIAMRNSVSKQVLVSPSRKLNNIAETTSDSVIPMNSLETAAFSNYDKVCILEAENIALVNLHISLLEDGVKKLPVGTSATERVRLLKATLNRLQTQEPGSSVGSNFILSDNHYKSLVTLTNKQQQRISDLLLMKSRDLNYEGNNKEIEHLLSTQEELLTEVQQKNDREQKLITLIEGQQSKVRELEQQLVKATTESGSVTANNPTTLLRIIDEQQAKIKSLSVDNNADAHHLTNLVVQQREQIASLENENLALRQPTAANYDEYDRFTDLITQQRDQITALEHEIEVLRQAQRETEPNFTDPRLLVSSIGIRNPLGGGSRTEFIKKEPLVESETPSAETIKDAKVAEQLKYLNEIVTSQSNQITSLEAKLAPTVEKDVEDNNAIKDLKEKILLLEETEIPELKKTIQEQKDALSAREEPDKDADLTDHTHLQEVVVQQQTVLLELEETLSIERKANEALSKVVAEQRNQLSSESNVDLASENSKLGKLVSDLQIKAAVCHSDKQIAQQVIDSLQSQISDFQAAAQSPAADSHHLNSLHTIINDQQMQLSELKVRAASPVGLTSENNRLLSLVSHLQEQLTTSGGGDNASLLRFIAEQKSKIIDLLHLTETLPTLQDTIKHLQDAIAEGKTVEEQQRDEITKLKSDLVSKDEVYSWDAQQHVQQKDDLRKKLQEKEKELQQINTNVNQQHQLNDSLQSTLENTAAKAAELQLENSELQSTLATHIAAAASLQVCI